MPLMLKSIRKEVEWHKLADKKEQQNIVKNYNKILKKIKQKKIILVSHNVLYKTKLDKIIFKKSPAHGHHYGSIVVRELIHKQKPILSLAGHMHEHGSKTIKLGKTICLAAAYIEKKKMFIVKINKNVKIKTI